MLRSNQKIKVHFARELWHSCKQIDIGKDYSSDYKRPQVMSKVNNLISGQLESYVRENTTVADLPERSLPLILKKQILSQRGSMIKRPILSRILQKRNRQSEGKPMTESMDALKKDSNLRRNRLVLEEIVRRREKISWMDQTTTMVHEMTRMR
jgi:hypothetical protein